MAHDSPTGRHLPDIEITPEMIQAGAKAYRGVSRLYDDDDSAAERIFLAMINASCSPAGPA